MTSRHWPPIVLLFVCLPLILPILHPGLLATGDGIAHLFRQLNYHQAVLDGQIPPRWAPLAAHSLGAPIFIYNWFLPYLFNEIFLFLGFSLVNAVKIFNIFCLLAAPFGMYLWVKKLTASPLPALLASIIFAWAPYRLMSIFLYGAWGEMLAITLVPFLGLAEYHLAQHPNRKKLVIASLLVGSIITSHNLSAFIYLPTITLITLISLISLRSFLWLSLTNLFGILITAFFWLPATALTPLIQYNIHQLFSTGTVELGHFPTLKWELWHTWFQFINPQAKVWYKDFCLGLPLYLATPFLIFACIKTRSKLLVVVTILGISSYLLWLHWAMPIWTATPLKVIIYSYRLLAPATILLCLSIGLSAKYLSKYLLIILTIASIPLAIRAGRLYLTPATGYINIDETYLSVPQPSLHPPQTGFIMGTMEFLPQTASEKFVRELDDNHPNQNLPKIAQIATPSSSSNLSYKTNFLSFDYSSPNPTSVITNTLFFPNWQASLGSYPLPISIDDVGRIRLDLPPATSPASVKLFWQTSTIEWIGITISLITLITLIFLSILPARVLSSWSSR
jgi:hypothetical protein